ncbi:hypothetical protein H0E87_015397 [Populus deltoides]|uniref:Uncharacterized protein n=1 Tax=Populus deltoides TaxID=3696 RepID=A0A8T2Y4T6_POPDE|nr:hypothetical protein H0E87_015397 [Populus deltoides]
MQFTHLPSNSNPIMDCLGGKKKSKKCEKGLRGLTEKVWLFQEEIQAIMYEREKEARAYERDMIVFAFKRAEWKQERKKLKEEVKRLRKVVEEKDERVRVLEERSIGRESEKREEFLGTTSFLVEQMREERVWRDEAVDKWKKLYLAIKAELDDLIQKTYHVLSFSAAQTSMSSAWHMLLELACSTTSFCQTS